MSLLDALTTLIDAARQQPETTALRRAIKRAEQRVEALRAKRSRALKGEVEHD